MQKGVTLSNDFLLGIEAERETFRLFLCKKKLWHIAEMDYLCA